MAFLTMVAPLVAFMYPIDKMNDGKAQGFDTWIKEYIFNAYNEAIKNEYRFFSFGDSMFIK